MDNVALNKFADLLKGVGREYYVLNKDGSVTTTSSVLEWAQARESTPSIGKTKIGIKWIKPMYLLTSTVFLGVEHGYNKRGEPLLFETMIFRASGGFLEIYMRRYATLEEAKAGHEEAVRWAKKNWWKWWVKSEWLQA